MAAVKTAPPEPALANVADTTANLGSGLGDFLRWIVSVQGQAVVALGVAALVTLALLTARRLIGRSLARGEIAADSWRQIAWDLVCRLTFFFALMAGLRIGVWLVEAPDAVRGATHLLFVIAAVVQCAIWAQALGIHLLSRVVSRHGNEGTLANAFILLRLGVMIIVWSIALLLLLDNLGVNVTALVAGLGIGGVAIALAAQSTIANFFSAFSIVTDRPFQQGDSIRFGTMTATVEEVGLRTTRLRSVDGHEVIVPNSRLMEEPIDNLTRRAERRVVVTIGVAYETPPAVLRELPSLIQACVERVETARLDRCHLAAFGPSSLDYELVFYTTGPAYVLMMDTRQAVLFNIFELLAARGIVIAYPTQTLYVVEAGETAG